MQFDRRALILALATAATWPMRLFAQARPDRQVLVFYYGWYGTVARSAENSHWLNPDTRAEKIADAPNYPVGGPYDSLDPAVIDRQMRQMKDAGITGLIASWWGQGDRTDRQFPLLLDAAAHYGLKVCPYVEQAQTIDKVAGDVLYLHRRYGRHAAWLPLDGKPVVFFFDRLMQTLGADGWKQSRARIEKQAPGALRFIGTANTVEEIAARKPLFDALHIYSMQFEAAEHRWLPALWRTQFYKAWVAAQSGARVTTATILPGFDDRLLPDRLKKRPVIKRRDGTPFRQLWRAAIGAGPDWILIVSFNEWHEASQIEPSTAFGARELDTCREMSALFRGA
ncbi:hypothetical protein AEAC466_09455 [Asticcacaulis sp. AC466]|uniref:hypothetical protein n=1 Tax=Asticcacaulis sp. AC466 TaxID=1282362 RepID=UPI0003C3F93A|nr:hypothetical protein [Asticcacaulis sp. AC466]ESQ84568.1 hypothetical protein AEAC466_09455 [Asticcacaulis sp. AC466]